MHFWCTFEFDALLMHFWCAFGALLIHFSKVHQQVHQNVLKVHQKCIKIKSASKVHQKRITSFDIVHLNFFKF